MIEPDTVALDFPLEAIATTKQIPYKGTKPFNGLNLTFKYLQAGATLETISDVLTQMGTYFVIKQGNKLVFKMSITDLFNYWMIEQKTILQAAVGDATGADNHVSYFTIPVTLSFGLLPEQWSDKLGLDPKDGKIVFEFVIPADANEIDNRTVTVTVFNIDDSKPKSYIRRVEFKHTFAKADDDNLVPLASKVGMKLCELFYYQTTSLEAGSTTDAEGLETISLEKGTFPFKVMDLNPKQFAVKHGASSKTAQTTLIPHTYRCIRFTSLAKPSEGIPLEGEMSWNFKTGVAEAHRFFNGLLITP